ncbi:uncharacterized protein [Dysidea avara]|uniref:uncharacterized protein isoform X2 n=1 Tax=Dysidea avara TaxID=196820 RepID=UPI003324E201
MVGVFGQHGCRIKWLKYASLVYCDVSKGGMADKDLFAQGHQSENEDPVSKTEFYCDCGQNFQHKGDLSQHQRYCSPNQDSAQPISLDAGPGSEENQFMCLLCGLANHTTDKCMAERCSCCYQPAHHDECPMINKKCARCKMVGHKAKVCGDSWRQFHNTITTDCTTIVKSCKVAQCIPYCYNCAAEGHLGYQCREAEIWGGRRPCYPFVKQYRKKQIKYLGKLPNLALADKDPASSHDRMDETTHTQTEHPETTPEGEVEREQPYNQEENPPKTKKKRQARRKRRHPQPTESEPYNAKKTKFENASIDTEPLADVNNAVTSEANAFQPQHESNTNLNKNEIDFPQSDVTSQPFVTGVSVAMFSDTANELNNDSAVIAVPNENPKKKRPRRKKRVNSQPTELKSKKIKLEKSSEVLADNSIVGSTSELPLPPQESLERYQYDNETQPVAHALIGPNVTMFFSDEDDATIAPQKNPPQAKNRRQRRRNKQTNSQSTELASFYKIPSETEPLPVGVVAWNDSKLPPPQVTLVENLNETDLCTSVVPSEPSVTMFSETISNEVSNGITQVPLGNNPPQKKKKRQNNTRRKHPPPPELEPCAMKETTLQNAAFESTTFIRAKKRRPRRKSKTHKGMYEERMVENHMYPSSHASLPSIASNAWQDLFPSYVSFSDNQSYQLRSKSGFVPDQLVSNSVDVVDAVL